jgi:hypothetical protein
LSCTHASHGIARRLNRRYLLAASAVVLVSAFIAGCEQETTPPVDPAKAPWLYDPQSQIEGLASRDMRLRAISAYNLGNMGALAAEAAPQLEKLAQDDPEPKVRDQARQALEKIRAADAAD